jgi:hypothetical protein
MVTNFNNPTYSRDLEKALSYGKPFLFENV